jgi:hypothetical protein
MSDIYKNQQQMPVVKPKPKRRRRSSSDTNFDETNSRRRRSSNTGLRRLLHLIRKEESESKIWWGALTLALVMLAIIGIWQFVVVEHTVRKQAQENEGFAPYSQQVSPSE